MSLIVVFVTLVLLYSLVSARLERTVLTAPIVFTAAGWLTLVALPESRGFKPDMTVFLQVAEIGLVLLLFTDACRTDLDVLRSIRNVPVRLLSAGLLLTLVLGGLFALLLFPELSLAEAGILSAILAPTDAGLGQVIVASEKVPLRVREALNVEAGLNDGLAVPFLLCFMAKASPDAGGGHVGLSPFIVQQLGYGALVGAGIGLLGGWLMGLADRRQWMTPAWRQLGVVALPLLCLLVSDAVGASMFIAAFVAGLAVQVRFREAARHSGEVAEDWGQLLNLSVFFLFGLLVARAWPELGWRHALYAALSLTVVRMLPVAVALIGTHSSRATVLFMGWFGPRGLASIVLGLVFIEHGPTVAGLPSMRLAVLLTVLLSIVAHGLSARPGVQLYARSVARLPPGAPELAPRATARPAPPPPAG